MADLTRRDFLGTSSAGAATFMNPLAALAASAGPVSIREVDVFRIEIPVSRSESEAGVYHRFNVVKIATAAGVNGYSFDGPEPAALPALRQLLGGQDVFAVERHIANGLTRWGSVEHALWDAIGKIANQPVCRLLGGNAESVPAYLTCVWKGYTQPETIRFTDQAEMARRVKAAGFKGMKIQAWRPKPMDNVEAVAAIRAAVGADFAIMVDRTAHAPEVTGQKIWDYDTGLKVARSLERLGVLWLEEPFARDDYQTPARLAAEVDILIAGGEGYTEMEPFRHCLVNRTYDVIQPDARNAGGILRARKIAILAEAFHVPCVLHGLIGPMMAGWLAATLATGCPWQEIVTVWPPLLPQELWAPALKIVRNEELFDIRDGVIAAPQHPGLGLDIDEVAIERFRVRT
jgi:L-alanine-DL-glutamate epimerase-like enolase superfamily enzyme